MKRYLLPIIRRSSSHEPQMFSHEQLCSGQGETELELDADLSYEDALLNSEIRHSLHTKYSHLEPPARTINNLMLAIQKGENQEAEVGNQKSEIRSRKAALSISGMISGAFTSLSRARVVSGGVALLVILSVLGGNISFVLTGDHAQSGSEHQQLAGDFSVRSGAIAVPPVRPPFFAPVYDAEALRHADPVETLAPPRREALHTSPPRHELTPRRPGPQ